MESGPPAPSKANLVKKVLKKVFLVLFALGLGYVILVFGKIILIAFLAILFVVLWAIFGLEVAVGAVFCLIVVGIVLGLIGGIGEIFSDIQESRADSRRERRKERAVADLENAPQTGLPSVPEPKALCTECGTEFLQSTATRTGGLCMRCFQGDSDELERERKLDDIYDKGDKAKTA